MASRSRPGRMLRCSEEAGWQSMLVQTFEQPASVSEYETVASPDALLVFVLEGSYELESFSSRGWKQAAYRPGIGGFTAPYTTNRLRWSAKAANTVKVLRLYLPQQYFSEAYETHRPAKLALPDALSLSDPTAFSVAKAALAAIEVGASNLYADACVRFLATHLVCRFENGFGDLTRETNGAALTDRRLRRVLEFMQHKFACELTIAQLAREAGISPFHFSRTFKSKVGITPHQYVRRLRLRHAQVLLAGTDLSVIQIAATCGYVHDGHFANSFREAFGSSPSAFRKLLHS